MTLSLSALAVPAYAAISAPSHTLTLTLDNVGLSCSAPTTVSGTATGKNLLREDVKITITNSLNPGVIYASAKAKVKDGSYQATLMIQNTDLEEGYLTVTATWHGVTVSVDEDGFWSC